MSLEFTDIKKYSKDDIDVCIANYKLVNPTKKTIILPPETPAEYTNLIIFTTKDSYNYLLKSISTTPVQKFNITIADLNGNVLCKYLHNRKSNRSGNIPYSDSSIELFSDINLEPFSDIENQQAVMFINELSGYKKIIHSNKNRLAIIDKQHISKTNIEKFKHIKLFTFSFFNSCSSTLNSLFSSVEFNEFHSNNIFIDEFIENILGRIITKDILPLNKMIHLNTDSNIIDIHYNNISVFTPRRSGRIHFNGSHENESGSIVIIGTNLLVIDDIEISFPYITDSINKTILNNCLELVNIIKKIPTDISSRKIFLQNNIKWIIKWLMNEKPYYDTDDIENNIIQIINNITCKYYNELCEYFKSYNSESGFSTPKKFKDNKGFSFKNPQYSIGFKDSSDKPYDLLTPPVISRAYSSYD
jgi:hypothetical protein